MKYYGSIAVLLILLAGIACREQQQFSEEQCHRPLVHFTPPQAWMNDPNGMVYYKGTYHLFYQHNPDSSVWGPMHWGHATSKDLVKWKHHPIALFPDELGTIFSGSAVVDHKNTAGFAKPGETALVAIYTQHDDDAEKEGRANYQNQSIAYSLDDGKSWIKYKGNPVLKNPGIKDFRDPKVIWHEPTAHWIMSLAVKDEIIFYSSSDLKRWKEESRFGKHVGAHGGVWECPDLFPLPFNDTTMWVLLVSMNPGAPNKGSGTQYFVGDFDGKIFQPYSKEIKWMDYGPDNYAGVTWSNTGDKKLLIGWMSNWMYANTVPTQQWKSAMTFPRELKLVRTGEEIRLASQPVNTLSAYTKEVFTRELIDEPYTLTKGEVKQPLIPGQLNFIADASNDFLITLTNSSHEKLLVGYDRELRQFYIDRVVSGKQVFHQAFAAKHTAPRFGSAETIPVTLVIDKTSVELFADKGLTGMTASFFPGQPYDRIVLNPGDRKLSKVSYATVLVRK